MKIARVFSGDINNRKGKFNNIYERIKHLKEVEGVSCDVYFIQYTYDKLFQKFKKVNVQVEEYSIIDGIVFKNLWIKLSLWEYIVTHRFKLKDIAGKKQLSQYVDLFKEYDMLLSHDLLSSQLATSVKKKYKIPFVITWHGSDINKYPFTNKKTYSAVKRFLKEANYNFFVSKKLKEVSDTIIETSTKTHLYSGPSEIFKPQSQIVKANCKKKLKLDSKYTVGFIGNLEPIKNVMVLPLIFAKIQKELKEVSFVVVGNGRLETAFKEQIDVLQVSNVNYTGKIKPKDIPEIMHALNVLVLPSLNEGMPRVTLEAQACGVHVVGSNVGGIPESIGERNSFVLGPNFIDNISKRIIEIILNKEEPSGLSNEFSWEKTIQKEMQVYNEILHNKIK